MICWSCPRCGAAVPQESELCGQCGFDSTVPLAAHPGAHAPERCLRCASPMQFAGTLQLHEGTRMWPVLLGNIGELLVNRKRFETFLCTGCGKVEFFMPPEPDTGP